MPATLNVNNLTVVHSGSGGISTAFPDVCKTPTPAGPVPIPYPNVAQSSNTADGSSTVKVDGNPIMLKGSNFSMSTGDEAGSAMNVMSSKIKGKAEPMLYSMDVKMDGQNVFRLTDMMLQNCGSAGTPPASEVQAPQPPGFLNTKECEKVKEKKDEQGKEIAKKNSGMYPPHFDAIEDIAKQMRVVFYFRQTNPLCLPWIQAKHQPKPHKVFKANTIKSGAPVSEVQYWLNVFKNSMTMTLRDKGLSEAAANAVVSVQINDHAPLLANNVAYHTDANQFKGVVGEPVVKDISRKPLKAVDVADQGSGNDYSNKWITGDYDLFQILYAEPGCKEVDQNHEGFSQIKVAINKACGWDAIQHGPQAQWVPNDEEKAEGAPNISFPVELKTALQTNNPNASIPIPGRSSMNVVDKEVTVISPAGVLFLEKPDDTMTALKCRECDK
jgi:uncharacterized Zn-binding protein involved in type VI secretion